MQRRSTTEGVHIAALAHAAAEDLPSEQQEALRLYYAFWRGEKHELSHVAYLLGVSEAAAEELILSALVDLSSRIGNAPEVQEQFNAWIQTIRPLPKAAEVHAMRSQARTPRGHGRQISHLWSRVKATLTSRLKSRPLVAARLTGLSLGLAALMFPPMTFALNGMELGAGHQFFLKNDSLRMRVAFDRYFVNIIVALVVSLLLDRLARQLSEPRDG